MKQKRLRDIFFPEGTKIRKILRSINEKIAKVISSIKKNGFKNTIKIIIMRLTNKNRTATISQVPYEIWIKNNEPSIEELEEQKNFKFKITPKISILVPLYKTPFEFFEKLIENLIHQTYSNWELCLADGNEQKDVKIENLSKTDERIKYYFIGENKNISGNTNEALKLATGDFIALLDHDDLLPVFSLYEIVKCINENPNVEFIYTDEDKIDEEGKNRFDPYFKPDFSPDTLRANNYITHFSIFKKEIMNKLGGERSKYNGAQDYDIILRMSEIVKPENIVHIPKVLYHWRVHQNSTAKIADAKPYAYEAGRQAVNDHIARLGLKASVEFGETSGVYQAIYEVIGNPKVCILIPNKDEIETLDRCINSILKLSTYNNYEIVVIENNSTEEETFKYYDKLKENSKIKVIYYPEHVFNYSAIINFGVKNCDGEYVVQLNNDTELITPTWIEKMLGFAQQERIGAVGARLYYPDDTIQHAGIVVGICGLAANMLTGLPRHLHGYFAKEGLIQNMSAVTGACLFAKRSIYEQVGFMDEENFAVAFNDVDFCLKIRQTGKLIVYNPFVQFYHYESKSRGYEDTPEKKARFERESNNFKEKWKDVIKKGDPYYNKNLSDNTAHYEIKRGVV